jgi:hypothetical protein
MTPRGRGTGQTSLASTTGRSDRGPISLVTAGQVGKAEGARRVGEIKAISIRSHRARSRGSAAWTTAISAQDKQRTSGTNGDSSRRGAPYFASIRIPAKKSSRSSCPCSGSTRETYWSGRTTTMQPVSRFTPRSSKMSSAFGSGQKTFS